ncbi:hypothetical protein ACHAWO_012259 [Cyclotella atomus]|uniref:PS II complex 12 kDa extrinsic protein n=1 Tax=Cyclotella atomus TaxID=382360 RepID=A0ABD3QX80_9STRA
MLNPTLIIAFQALLLRPSAAFAPSSPRCSPVVLLSCISQDDAEMPSRSNHLADDKRQTTRREALSAALVTLTTFTSSAQAAVIGAGRCANGEGDGCDSLAEGNAYIQSLQKKSLENKEENQREALYSYYMRNYPDVFAVSDKRMVMKSDGSFELFSPGEVADLVNNGKITIEYPKTMGGRVVDLTQKPVLVLKD